MLYFLGVNIVVTILMVVFHQPTQKILVQAWAYDPLSKPKKLLALLVVAVLLILGLIWTHVIQCLVQSSGRKNLKSWD